MSDLILKLYDKCFEPGKFDRFFGSQHQYQEIRRIAELNRQFGTEPSLNCLNNSQSVDSKEHHRQRLLHEPPK